MVKESNGFTSEQIEGAPIDPYGKRVSELVAELHDKTYETSDEELAQLRAELEVRNSESDGLEELRHDFLSSPLGLYTYYQARRRSQEIREIIAAEGLEPPIQ
jgi:hypothetical protein